VTDNNFCSWLAVDGNHGEPQMSLSSLHTSLHSADVTVVMETYETVTEKE